MLASIAMDRETENRIPVIFDAILNVTCNPACLCSVFGKGSTYGAGAKFGSKNAFAKKQKFGPGSVLGDWSTVGGFSTFEDGTVIGSDNQVGKSAGPKLCVHVGWKLIWLASLLFPYIPCPRSLNTVWSRSAIWPSRVDR